MHKLLTTVVVLALVAGASHAQNTLRLNFDQAVQMAKEQNLELRQGKNTLQLNQVELTQTKMNRLPTVSANTGANRQIGLQYLAVGEEIVVTNVVADFVSSNINAELPLFTGFNRVSATKAASNRLIAQEEQLKALEQNMVVQVARRYLQVMLDKELVRIHKENLENQKNLLRQIEGFVESGIRAPVDALNQKTEIARVEMSLLDAEITLENDLQIFASELMLEPGVKLELESMDMAAEMASMVNEYELDDLFQYALSSRPDYKRFNYTVEAFRNDIRVARSGFMPQVSAFYNLNTYYTSLDPRGFQTQYLEVYPTNTVGLRLNVPIFSNYRHKLNLVRAEVNVQNESLEQERLKRQIFQEVQTAYLNFDGAKRRLKGTSVQKNAAEEAFKVQNERFRLGVANFVEVSQSNQQLIQAQADYSQAYYSVYFNELILKYSVGLLR